jgi:cytochrome b561
MGRRANPWYLWAHRRKGWYMEEARSNSVPAYEATYSLAARRFHWWTVAALAVQIPLGLYMAYRMHAAQLFGALTDSLYSTHKLLGICILLLVLARLGYRLANGAPPDEPTITWWQKGAAHATHWALYLMLLVTPVLGYIGISLFDARDVFGLFSLPPLTAPNQALASQVFFYHLLAAIIIVLLAGAHIGGALFHYFIRRDGVLRRMFVRAGRLGGGPA